MRRTRSALDVCARILLLGDDPSLLGVLEAILLDEGYRVQRALRHGDGLAVVRERQPDLLILDLMFSGRDSGLVLLEQVKREPALCGVPVLVCSAVPAHSLKTHAVWLARHGVVVLPKPFDLDQLLRIVETLLSRQGGELRPLV